MPIKFTCPHCKRGFAVKDQFAGKRGACPACKQIVTIPQAAATQVTTQKPAPQPSKMVQPAPVAPKVRTPPPPPPPVDVEAEAAALFADEPAPTQPTEVKTIDLNCPFCDEAIHFPVDLAGKRAQCPECKHLLKVPELAKKDPVDWRKTAQRGPWGARLPDQSVPEGAWGSAAASTVGKEALEEAGVIGTEREPLTRGQKIGRSVLGVTSVVVLLVAGWGGYRWWNQRMADRAIRAALDYAASPEAAKEAGPIGQAAIAVGAGEYYLNSNVEKPAVEADNHIGKAITTLRSAPANDDRDMLLTELALAEVELGGEKPEVDKDRRLTWRNTQQLLLATLQQIHNPDARREAVRAVIRRLIAHGQSAYVLSLVKQLYSTTDVEQAAALSVAGLELLKANDRTGAEKALHDALALYDDEEPLPLRAEVVALSRILKGKSPEPGEDDAEDKRNDYVGRVEALAWTEKWDEARQQADKTQYGEIGQFLALLALAAAGEGKSADTSDVEKAITLADAKLRDKPALSWSLLRLTRLAIRAGVAEERLQTLADCIANRTLRGWAQFAIFRARLAQTKQPVEDSAADKIEPASLARLLAAQALARHNTRLHTSWSQAVGSWQQPLQAFGSLGVALGRQDRVR